MEQPAPHDAGREETWLSTWAADLAGSVEEWASLATKAGSSAVESGTLHKRELKSYGKLVAELAKKLTEYTSTCDRQTFYLGAQLLSAADLQIRADGWDDLKSWFYNSLALRFRGREPQLIDAMHLGSLRGFPVLVSRTPLVQDSELLDYTIQAIGGFVPDKMPRPRFEVLNA